VGGGIQHGMKDFTVVHCAIGESPNLGETTRCLRPSTRLDRHESNLLNAEVPPVCPERPLEILYRDDALVVINKPSGLFVHRTWLDFDARTFVIQRLRDQLGQKVYPAHRLDRATSGVLALALDKAALPHLAQSFERGCVTKSYLAVVRGWPESPQTIDYPLKRFTAEDGDGAATGPEQSAVTTVEVLARAELDVRVDRYPTSRYALVSLTPTTGRRHQLRRHLRHIHHPIIGDTTYGQGRHNRLFRERFDSHRLLLHASRLTLEHPTQGTPMNWVAGLDDVFRRVCAGLSISPPTIRPDQS
jgi:tRNA pseudouridine65 synthase